MTVISNSVKELFVAEGDKLTDSITLAVPFSLRRPIKTANDFEFDNQFSILPLNLPLTNDFATGLPIVKREMDLVKKSP